MSAVYTHLGDGNLPLADSLADRTNGLSPKRENGSSRRNSDSLSESFIGSDQSTACHYSDDQQQEHDVGSIVEDDPFHVFKEDLLRKLSLLEEGLKRYLLLVRSTDTAANAHEIRDAKKSLRRHLKNAESALSDLETTVRQVELKRIRFSHISDVEFANRKTFVSSCSDTLANVKAEMNTPDIRAKLSTDEAFFSQRQRRQRISPKEKEEALFVSSNRTNAQLMLQQQEDTLEDLDLAVVRVSHMADTIHHEVRTQNKMLGHLEEDLNDAEEKLGLVMGKLGKMLKTKNKCQLGSILCLSLVVLLLFFLVIYT